MVRLHEGLSKELAKKYNIRVPKGRIVSDPVEAKQVSEELGSEVVLKALVPVGRRMKKGGVLFARHPEEAYELCSKLFGTEIDGWKVERILVEERLRIKQELFLSITFDPIECSPIALISGSGGIDVEDLLRKSPSSLVIHNIKDFVLNLYQARELLEQIGLTGQGLLQASTTLWNLWALFRALDCKLAEINPLVITENEEVYAASIILDIDEYALPRHPELHNDINVYNTGWKPATPRERMVIDIDLTDKAPGSVRFTELGEGELGFRIAGGGMALYCFDRLSSLNCKISNFADASPGPNEDKKYVLYKAILTLPNLKAVIVGGPHVSQASLKTEVKALVRAIEDTNSYHLPIYARFVGRDEEEARKIIQKYGNIRAFGDEITIDEFCDIVAKDIAMK
jgi:succinyl-CoA synthetase beta subunit/citryl-CoA synthetase large subunit